VSCEKSGNKVDLNRPGFSGFAAAELDRPFKK